jgi:hypothetical protein
MLRDDTPELSARAHSELLEVICQMRHLAAASQSEGYGRAGAIIDSAASLLETVLDPHWRRLLS